MGVHSLLGDYTREPPPYNLRLVGGGEKGQKAEESLSVCLQLLEKQNVRRFCALICSCVTTRQRVSWRRLLQYRDLKPLVVQSVFVGKQRSDYLRNKFSNKKYHNIRGSL